MISSPVMLPWSYRQKEKEAATATETETVTATVSVSVPDADVDADADADSSPLILEYDKSGKRKTHDEPKASNTDSKVVAVDAGYNSPNHQDDLWVSSSDHENNNNHGTVDNSGLWIIVYDWAEGISAWMNSMSEVIVLAKNFNATLVEPTISRGRLNSTTSGAANVLFTDVFDREQIVAYHPKLASFEEYQQAVAARTVIGNSTSNGMKNETAPPHMNLFKVCLSKWANDRWFGGLCAGKGSKDAGKKYSKPIEEAIEMSRIYPDRLVVLEVNYLTHNAFKKMHLKEDRKTKLVDNNETAYIRKEHLRFHPKLFQVADVMLSGMGIAPGSEFATIHWRAEKDSLDYMGCANAIVTAKNAILQSRNTTATATTNTNTPEMPFVLMSSLNSNPLLQWSGAAKKAEGSKASAALEFLTKQAGFHMLDSVVLKNAAGFKEEMIYLVVLDLIIASRATVFSTCTRPCRKGTRRLPSYCVQCNFLGSFAEMAIRLRERTPSYNKNDTLRCWPQINTKY